MLLRSRPSATFRLPIGSLWRFLKKKNKKTANMSKTLLCFFPDVRHFTDILHFTAEALPWSSSICNWYYLSVLSSILISHCWRRSLKKVKFSQVVHFRTIYFLIVFAWPPSSYEKVRFPSILYFHCFCTYLALNASLWLSYCFLYYKTPYIIRKSDVLFRSSEFLIILL